MQKFLTKMFNKLNSMLNVKDNIYMTKWGLFQVHKDGSTYANQSMWYTTSTKEKTKTA